MPKYKTTIARIVCNDRDPKMEKTLRKLIGAKSYTEQELQDLEYIAGYLGNKRREAKE